MNVRSLLGTTAVSEQTLSQKAFQRYGVIRNPFPSAAQTFDHPRLPIQGVDQRIVDAVHEFEGGENKTRVFVVEGTQGVGKTNLLNNYQRDLEDYFSKEKGFYIIKYYPDPERDFDRIVRRIFQDLGEVHLLKLVSALSEMSDEEMGQEINSLRSYEVRVMLRKLVEATKDQSLERSQGLALALQWLTGLRLLNRHRDALGVQFRLDTVESRTQALHDVVYLGAKLGVLKGLILLLDELEKQGSTLPEKTVTLYLSAIRALIDSLPRHLFMILAITPEARTRYYGMLPALASRLSDILVLNPLTELNQAQELYKGYLGWARDEAVKSQKFPGVTSKSEELFSADEIKNLYTDLYSKSAEAAFTGVTQREFLRQLSNMTNEKFEHLV
ncbi:MAG: ATP-binding protein [Thermoplasmata archaeon]|nr:ATP-binding protein [Thermoplasmata archaeon]